jgi:long-chain acyl-CoA synthetase
MRRWLVWPQPDFPRTTTGKVLRRQLAPWVAQSITTGGPAQPVGGDPLLRAIGTLPGVTLPDQPRDATRLSEDLHLDSLGLVELQSMLESSFGVEIDDQEWQGVRTVGDLRRLVQMPTPEMAMAAGSTPAEPRSGLSTDTGPGSLKAREASYPKWPWSLPLRSLRAAFLEGIARPLTWLLLGPRVQHEGGTPDLSQPMLIVANHVTAFDPALVLYALPGAARRRVAIAMAAHILLGWRHARVQRHRLVRPLAPFAYWLVTALFNAFPLPQGAGLRRSFIHAGEALDRGMHVLLFPEGRRSADGALAAFQSGIGLLAQESGVPVLPVYLEGLGAIKQRRIGWLRPGTVAVRVGEPLSVQPGESPQAFTERLHHAVAALAVAALGAPR